MEAVTARAAPIKERETRQLRKFADVSAARTVTVMRIRKRRAYVSFDMPRHARVHTASSATAAQPRQYAGSQGSADAPCRSAQGYSGGGLFVSRY